MLTTNLISNGTYRTCKLEFCTFKFQAPQEFQPGLDPASRGLLSGDNREVVKVSEGQLRYVSYYGVITLSVYCKLAPIGKRMTTVSE
jgi:hypothetical protein